MPLVVGNPVDVDEPERYLKEMHDELVGLLEQKDVDVSKYRSRCRAPKPGKKKISKGNPKNHAQLANLA